MRIGVTLFQTDQGPPPAVVARAAEERGFASYFVPEHTHIPIDRTTPWPMNPDTELPRSYARTLDPYVGLATAAAVTSRIRLGTGIALVAQHDPIALAKTIATLDVLSGGRFTLGIGFGWNKEEMSDHGVAFTERRDVVREYVEAMSALWRDDDVSSYDGKRVRVTPSWVWPKPVQQPRPPVLIGGAAGPKLFGAIADWADGWMPIGGSGLRTSMPQLQDAWASADRAGSPVVMPFGVLPEPGKLEYYAELGITDVVVNLDEGDEATVLRSLDRHTAFLPSM
jgi:probable F420-dependent oxidoreductase